MAYLSNWKSLECEPLVAMFAESSPQVGTGHVVEMLSIAHVAMGQGIPVELWVNRGTEGNLISESPCRVNVIDDFSVSSLRDVARGLTRHECGLVVTNFRRISNSQIETLGDNGRRVACIDELGNTRLDCDLVINPSIVSRYHNYPSDNPDFRLFTGPAYLPLADDYRELNQRPRSFSGGIGNVVVAMGGVDRCGSTLKIAESLRDWRPGITKHIVLGASFMYRSELENILSQTNHLDFVIYQDLRSLTMLLFEGDVGFTAGGNTLYELACVGTPALVLYEDDHEMEQGIEFQRNGFGVCLGRGVGVTKSRIWRELDKLEEPDVRETWSRKGRSVVDGKGVERVLASLSALCSNDSAVQTRTP